MASAKTYSSPISSSRYSRSPPAPSDLGTYSRALISYTQRQMEGLRIGHSRSEAASGDKSASPPVNVPNGVSPSASATMTRRRNSKPSASSVLANPPSPASSEFGYRD